MGWKGGGGVGVGDGGGKRRGRTDQIDLSLRLCEHVRNAWNENGTKRAVILTDS